MLANKAMCPRSIALAISGVLSPASRLGGHLTYYVDSSVADHSNGESSPAKVWKSLDKVYRALFQPANQIFSPRDLIYRPTLDNYRVLIPPYSIAISDK